MGFGEEASSGASLRRPSASTWGEVADMLDTCRLPPEYRDSPKTQAGLGHLFEGLRCSKAGIFTATAVGRRSHLWAVWMATDA